ncbi:MAG: hypothetical protein A3G05_01915 [Candidatus Zambryskibacteria bacterium RIFCSPLOWO2_12_FULL_45_14]|uniref:Transposase IS200-like domain-containing protein n=2 Tax=Candidatus Zambryskiibacteriota TaxID=1817925 RepID=A0A1G2ULI2_9BACT|nr:MAG: hypothetical protein A3H60_01865 [Candidatus Zambryskibacteria bacterium RIFCSPLOWO2_02_FULL_44_12b]OHB14107.1 MAG: hypothetical protein A3G05_01915 [Candidatus Zambryskibacteria bacterium RIFCSPLOWO2_12_FULL_45_14]
MQRKVNFVTGEYYHVFSRGVERRNIFQNNRDCERFLASLYILNQRKNFYLSDFLKRKGKQIPDLYQENREDALVSILAFSLMPNHFHILVREIREGGISKFMSRLLTTHSMYFNIKYKRSGPLFIHPFRSVHVDDDIHFRHLFSYIHLNCIDIIEPKWKERGITNNKQAQKFLLEYKYSSYPDLSDKNPDRIESGILDIKSLLDSIPRTTLRNIKIEDFEKWTIS